MVTLPGMPPPKDQDTESSLPVEPDKGPVQPALPVEPEKELGEMPVA